MFKHDFDLTPYTTFGVPATAALFAEYSSVRELTRIFRSDEYNSSEVFHIGGGSNLLFTRPFDGLVLHSAIKGMKLYERDAEHVFAICGAGEKWTDFVDWTLDQGLAGLENLAGIPGEVGASPVQNVGAYGVEAGELIHSVEVFDSVTGKTETIKGGDCGFGYRDSKFKHEWKGRYFVLRVSFLLKRRDYAEHLDYGPLKELSARLGHSPSPREVADEVLKIRDSKLPSPSEIGSAGSFFKNPVINRYLFNEEIKRLAPDIPFYELPNGMVKLPAGWLIEHAGMKGERVGGAQVYPKQCLVITNTGGATARDVTELAEKVRHAVASRFNVDLSPEVNYIDSTITVTVLGSGTSKGVPEIGCGCHVCSSEDSRDKRLRASILIRTSGLTLLVDPSPDFREQMLRHNVRHIDAILITHSHYDHVGGLDDVRPLNVGIRLPLYMEKNVSDDLHRRLDYCFREAPYPGVPQFEVHEITDAPFAIDGVRILPIRVMHAKLPILGFRIGNFAYVTDAKTVPEEEKWKLEGLDVLILNALRDTPHFSHLSLQEAEELVEEVKPRVTYLTHISHQMGLHAEREATLPPTIRLAYDGLTIRLES